MVYRYRPVFWASGLLSVCLAFSATPGWAQAGTPKSAKSRPAKKPVKATPAATEEALPPINPNDLPLGVQDNLAEAKRLEEQYRREAAARRRAEAEARKKGLPWPPEEANPESQPAPPPPAAPVSPPAPPPEDTTPPPADPPVESQSASSQSAPTGGNAQPVPSPPPPPPADGKTIIRTWPQSKKPAKSTSPQ